MSLISLLQVNVAEQTMHGFDNANQCLFKALISTATNGVGQISGSECTPLGEHRIRAKIGANQPVNTVFIGRRPSGEIYSEELGRANPNRDWILSRILWLCGNDIAYNRGGLVDTQRRYIYIHGAPDSHAMGVPSSHGCIKMRNSDMIELFDKVAVGTLVNIQEKL